MGIDIYLKWKGMTKAEHNKQITGWSVEHGHAGYLREAYHGGPYVTKYLLKEAFESGTEEVQIPAKVLRKRLREAIRLAKQRQKEIYDEDKGDDDPVVKSFVDFVELAEKMEKKTGEPVTILASY